MAIVRTLVVMSILSAASLPAAAQHSDGAKHASPYAGQEQRAIKSLSADDIDELKRGAGWGLAKAAELNGVPGPVHLLELREQIKLTDDQANQLQRLYDGMKSAAIPLGHQLIAQEQQLEALFRSELPSDDKLKKLLQQIGETRSELRFIHLRTHLRTPQILNKAQIVTYNQLRGYDAGNPCDAVPEGHDAAMWKRHNGCQ